MLLTVDKMRLAEKIENENGTSNEQLMENAGVASFDFLSRLVEIEQQNVVILAGSGNNAGDGFVLARKLSQAGARVLVILCCGEDFSPLARQNYNSLLPLEVSIIRSNDADGVTMGIMSATIVVDAIYGIGFRGELPVSVAQVLFEANSLKSKGRIYVALDVPSGVFADGGEVDKNSFRADLTFAFATLKPAHDELQAKDYCGNVELLDIGISEKSINVALKSPSLITERMVKNILPKREQDSHKGMYGKLLNISGSFSMGGAAMMSTLSAMRIGAGAVRLATPVSIANMVSGHLMEAMTVAMPESRLGSLCAESLNTIGALMGKSSAVLVGCGLAINTDTKQIVEYILKNTSCNIVVDADGLNCLEGKTEALIDSKGMPILTPHIGEMARLAGKSVEEVLDNPAKIAKGFAMKHNVIVVLKAHKTVIASNYGNIYYNETGNAGLAKAGSGDVLAGMIAGLVAQGFAPLDAALCGVYIHGRAADRLVNRMSQYSILARDVIDEIPSVMFDIGR